MARKKMWFPNTNEIRPKKRKLNGYALKDARARKKKSTEKTKKDQALH